MTHDEMIAVIAAHRDGKEVEYQTHSDGPWRLFSDPETRFNFYSFRYRIKPSPPKPREYSVCICPTLNSGLPQIGGIKKDWPRCHQCEVFHVIEVLPSSGESAS